MEPDACYDALRARDHRFDGVFFVGVTTTGVYCRPICPARTPGRDRCRFFRSAAAAEREGFRACFRCRPESAPGLAPTEASAQLVAAATRRIEAGFLNDHSLEELADGLEVTARHLRRTFKQELGVTPNELARSRRLGVARQLLTETALPVTDVAFAAGFRSIRTFNTGFLERFGRPPSAMRRAADAEPALRLRLSYRPPFDWPALLAFLGARAIPGVERVSGDVYARAAQVGGLRGQVTVRPAAGDALLVQLDPGLAPRLMEVVQRIRRLFDLDARPGRIAEALGRCPTLAPRVARSPGLRVPGAFDPFELSVRVVLGQMVSVKAATTLSGRLVARFGVPIDAEGLTHTFPDAARLARASAEEVAAIGLPLARARAIVALAGWAQTHRFDGVQPEATARQLLALPGIGPWTVQAIAMRTGWPDAFPAGDLILRRRLGVDSAAEAERAVEPCRPFRAYAAMHLWHDPGDTP
ncbi:MAG: helix-turn-helix domain-containing protein [Alphaproteobacteria bacterium]|nr:helix-turn-helix domain-containing protein [Alphaproteobacteria bacterium]